MPAEAFPLESILDLGTPIAQPDRVSHGVPEGRAEETLLVDAARRGEHGAFAELYRRWSRAVHGVLLASVPGQDVDDMVQDVFLQAFRSLHALRDTGAFGGWLLTIARNLAADYHRRPNPVEELPEDVAAPASREGHEARAALDAVRSLPRAYRETLTLRLVEGMTGPEIAERTGLTPDSVRVNLHRGMKLLREKLGWEKRRD